MSTISAGTTSGTALVNTGDTTGQLILQTNGTTTAVTIGTNQVVTLAQPLPAGSGGFSRPRARVDRRRALRRAVEALRGVLDQAPGQARACRPARDFGGGRKYS